METLLPFEPTAAVYYQGMKEVYVLIRDINWLQR